MTVLPTNTAPLQHPGMLYIGGTWVPATSSSTFDVIDSATEETYFRVAEAGNADVDRAIEAARQAFDEGPWPQLTHQERAGYLRQIAEKIRERGAAFADIWPRQSGMLHSIALQYGTADASTFEYYADLADTYPFEEPRTPQAGGEFALLAREPVGVVAAIIPWNGPMTLLTVKVGPALLAGCTVIVKAAPEAPGEAYVFAEIAEEIGFPLGVINVITAEREASFRLVQDPRVDKVAFTGSTATGRRIAAELGSRIGRYTLELGGKSAAVILEDADIAQAASNLAMSECLLTGQVCSSLTRFVLLRRRRRDTVGLAPFIASVVTRASGGAYWSVSLYLTLGSALTLASLIYLRRRATRAVTPTPTHALEEVSTQ